MTRIRRESGVIWRIYITHKQKHWKIAIYLSALGGNSTNQKHPRWKSPSKA
jgi:hypothetical protein